MSQLREVDLPELGEGRKLREPLHSLTTRVRKLQRRADKGEDVEDEQIAAILSACVVDSDGKRVFATEPEAAKALADLPSRVLVTLMKKFTGLTKADEDLSGNSEGSPSSV